MQICAGPVSDSGSANGSGISGLGALALTAGRYNRRLATSGVRCSVAYQPDAACRSLRRVADGAALTASTKNGVCAWTSRPGSRRLPMRRQWLLAPSRPFVAPYLHGGVRVAVCLRPVRFLEAPRLLAQQAHASMLLAELCGKMFRLRVLCACRSPSDGDPRGGTGVSSLLSQANFDKCAG